MMYPYIDYYKSTVDSHWHVVEHYGPDNREIYRCKLLVVTKTEREAKSYIKDVLKTKPRKRGK